MKACDRAATSTTSELELEKEELVIKIAIMQSNAVTFILLNALFLFLRFPSIFGNVAQSYSHSSHK